MSTFCSRTPMSIVKTLHRQRTTHLLHDNSPDKRLGLQIQDLDVPILTPRINCLPACNEREYCALRATEYVGDRGSSSGAIPKLRIHHSSNNPLSVSGLQKGAESRTLMVSSPLPVTSWTPSGNPSASVPSSRAIQ